MVDTQGTLLRTLMTTPTSIEFDHRDFPPTDFELAMLNFRDRSGDFDEAPDQDPAEDDFGIWVDDEDCDDLEIAPVLATCSPAPRSPVLGTPPAVQSDAPAVRAYRKLDRRTRHGLPNALLLSAVFRPVKPGIKARKNLANVELPSFENSPYRITVSGPVLDQADRDAFCLLALAAQQDGKRDPESVVLGTTVVRLLKELRRGDSGPERRALMATLDRLSELHLQLNDGAVVFCGEVMKYAPLPKGELIVRFDSSFYGTFSRGRWTQFPWNDRCETLRRKPLAQWLHGVFCASMREEATYSVDELYRVSCVNVGLPEFRRMLKNALAVLQRTAAVKTVVELSSEQLRIKRIPNAAQQRWQENKLQHGVPRPVA